MQFFVDNDVWFLTSKWTNKILTVEFLLFHIPVVLVCGYFVSNCFIDFKVSLTFWEYWFIYVTCQGTFPNIGEHFGYFLVVPTIVIFMGKIWSHPSGWCFSLPSTSCGDFWRMLLLSWTFKSILRTFLYYSKNCREQGFCNNSSRNFLWL